MSTSSLPPSVDTGAHQAPAQQQTLTPDEALRLAMDLHRRDQLEPALQIYAAILKLVPDHADALAFNGMALHQSGRSEEGLVSIRRAIERVPGFAGFQINLGNMLVEMHRLSEALQVYEDALRLVPDSSSVISNKGVVLNALGHQDDAEAAFRKAVALDPENARAWNNLGGLLWDRGLRAEAKAAMLTAIDLTPDKAEFMRGWLYYKFGAYDKAADIFRQLSLAEPDNARAAHLYAACSGQGVPDRASDAYVEAEFDGFAASFEQVLNDRLHYRAPELCVAELRQLLPPPAATLDVLDAGCGTGLCGPLVAPWARRLVGVDLSAGMLSRARQKGVYDDLVKAELTAWLQAQPPAWHVVVCADTLCYFGDLHTVLQATAQALQPGGVFVFTVEALDDDGSTEARILPNGRYAHGRAHVDAALSAAGLQLQRAHRQVLRKEGGLPVHGWVVAATRTAAS